MNEARVYADGFERSFAEVKDLLEFLAERGRNAKWIRKPTNTLRLAPLEKEAQNLDAADASMEEILEDTEKNTQLVLKMRGESYPVRDCAIRTILSRAGVNGDGLRKLDKATYAKVVNYCLRVAKGDALIKIADGKVSAVHGGDKHDYCIACLGMDALLTVGKKNGKPLKKRPKILLLGIFLTLIGLISLLFYWGKISKSIPTVFLNAGMCLLMISLAGYYFVRLNKKEKKYYKRITWLENWYHRFFYNINMSFVVAAFLVIIMTDFSIKLLDNLPITEPKNYPYDLVWMTNKDDEEFLNHLTDDEGVGANMAVMMNIPENYDKVVEEIKAYAQDHSQVNYFDADNGNLIYEKKELLLERSKTKLLYVASAAGNIIIMLLCGIFVLSIKMECDFPETEWKYRFYIQSGMSSAKVRKGIIKECLLSGGLPVICGTIISILYCSMLLYAKHLQIEWVHRYFKGIILIVGAIWLLFAVFIFIFAYRNIRKIEGDSGNGKK